MLKPKPTLKRNRDKADPQVTGLVLARRAGELVTIDLPNGEAIVVQVLSILANQTTLIFSAPKSIKITRGELDEQPESFARGKQ